MENPGMQVPFQNGKKLILRVAGDLHLLGSEEADLFLSGHHPRRIKVKDEDNMVQVISNEDAWVRVPAGADVRVEHVGGDASIFALTGSVEVNFVGGDLKFNGAEKLDVGHVGGDLTVAEVSDTVTVRRVGGDFTCDVTGSISVEMVGGDSALRVMGGARLRTGGDISMKIGAPVGDEVVLKAGGDMELFVPGDIQAQLDLTSGGRDVEIQVGDRHDTYEQPNVVVNLGSGERSIRAKAGGDIKVSDGMMDMKDIANEFADFEHEFKQGRFHEFVNMQDPQYWSGFEQRIQERAMEAARRAEERVRAAMERVERDNRRRERSFERKFGRQFGFFGVEIPDMPGHPEAPGHPAAPSHPEAPASSQPEAQAPVAETPAAAYDYASASAVTNEERMLVLKMLQEHKITVEEAEQLLAELEGQFD